jgi:hypothetical protein
MLSAGKIEGGPPGPAENFTQIGDLLRETDASPALRSALYQVAETIPGVISEGARFVKGVPKAPLAFFVRR